MFWSVFLSVFTHYSYRQDFLYYSLDDCHTDHTFCTLWMTAGLLCKLDSFSVGWLFNCYRDCFFCALSSWGKWADCHADQTFCALWRIVHSRVDCRHVYGTCVHGMWQTSLIYFNIYPALWLWLKVLYSYKERLVRTTVNKGNFKQQMNISLLDMELELKKEDTNYKCPDDKWVSQNQYNSTLLPWGEKTRHQGY